MRGRAAIQVAPIQVALWQGENWILTKWRARLSPVLCAWLSPELRPWTAWLKTSGSVLQWQAWRKRNVCDAVFRPDKNGPSLEVVPPALLPRGGDYQHSLSGPDVFKTTLLQMRLLS